jgi:hypothetical protein
MNKRTFVASSGACARGIQIYFSQSHSIPLLRFTQRRRQVEKKNTVKKMVLTQLVSLVRGKKLSRTKKLVRATKKLPQLTGA